MLGALHAALQGDIVAVQQGKAKRSMFAETQRERLEILEAVKASEWNREMDPLVTSVHCAEVVKHDFSSGFVSASVHARFLSYCTDQTATARALFLSNSKFRISQPHTLHDTCFDYRPQTRSWTAVYSYLRIQVA